MIMEINYIAKLYGKYLGGIDCEKIIRDVKSSESEKIEAIERMLGLRIECDVNNYLKFEILRIKSIVERLRIEEEKLQKLIEDLKLSGVTSFEAKTVLRRLRCVKRLRRIYINILRQLSRSE